MGRARRDRPIVISRGPLFLLATFAALVAARCQVPAEDAGTPAGGATSAPTVARVEAAAGPDTTGESLRAWLEGERYRETWEPWPGTLPLHPGAEPHGALLTTYVDPVALAALERGATLLPEGAAVLVENYLADSTLFELSVMVKAPGYDPERQDWFFARFGSSGEIEAAGRVESCAGCHVQKPDYLFSGELGVPFPIDSTGATDATADSL